MARILVIDDNEEFCGMLCEMLEREGYDVVSASDGQKGLDIYRENPTDLVITDIVMPNKEGVETIIELNNEFPDVKIIVVSGGGRGRAEDYIESVKVLGNIKYAFCKPFAIDGMLKAVKDLVGE